MIKTSSNSEKQRPPSRTAQAKPVWHWWAQDWCCYAKSYICVVQAAS